MRGYHASVAETQFSDVGTVRYAYRVIGPHTVTPLVLLNRFSGTR